MDDVFILPDLELNFSEKLDDGFPSVMRSCPLIFDVP